MDDKDEGCPLSDRDKIVLGRALRDESEQELEADAIADLTFELDPELFTFGPDSDEFSTPSSSENFKRPRLDYSTPGPEYSLQSQPNIENIEMEHPLQLPGSSQSVRTALSTLEPQAQLIPDQPVIQPEGMHHLKFKEMIPTELNTENIEQDYGPIPAMPLPRNEDETFIPLSPLCLGVDEDCWFGPDYFWNYCDDGDTPDVMALLDVMDSEEALESSEDEPTETSTCAQEEKDVPLYKGAPINQIESLTSILSFVSSEHLSGSGFKRLLALINLHLPQPNNFLKSNANVWNVLENLDETVYIHYFCSVCYKIRGNASDLCDTCKDESKCVLFFITFPLVPQLKKMFARSEFRENLKYKERRVKKNIDSIEDIYDGQNYKEAEKNFTESCLNLTLMFNTDGMQVFNSTSFSLWPFYLVINELPPSKRFLSENLLIAGLWGSVAKPHPNIFLLPNYKDLKLLEKGIEVDGEEGITKVVAKVISGTCDAPACACLMNMKLHSGFYSCPVCLVKGEKPGDATVFPYEDQIILRNIPQYEEHKRWAVEKKVILSKTPRNEDKWCGIKGPTILSDIVPNMFDAMAIDSMHCVYLGTMKQLLNLWTDKDYKDRPFSAFLKLKIINARLREISSPHFLQRSIQTLDKLVYWKATEYRSFMFNLSLVILRDILPPDYYVHLSYFVSGVALLNMSSVSEDNLALASSLLKQFVSQFSFLYGPENMTYNLHKLLHLERCVRLHGPLFISSCFQFEDINGRLSNFIHGTRHVGLQIHSKLSIITKLPFLVQNLKEGEAKDFCTNILKKKNKLKIREKISPGVCVVGSLKDIGAEFSWVKDELASIELLSPSSVVQIFGRLLKNKMLYVSKCYQRGKRVSSYIKYFNGSCFLYGLVECFVKISCSCSSSCTCVVQYLAIIKKKEVCAFEVQNIVVPHIVTHPCIVNSSDVNVVDVQYLSTVMFKLDSVQEQEIFLCEPLNQFELE